MTKKQQSFRYKVGEVIITKKGKSDEVHANMDMYLTTREGNLSLTTYLSSNDFDVDVCQLSFKRAYSRKFKGPVTIKNGSISDWFGGTSERRKHFGLIFSSEFASDMDDKFKNETFNFREYDVHTDRFNYWTVNIKKTRDITDVIKTAVINRL